MKKNVMIDKFTEIIESLVESIIKNEELSIIGPSQLKDMLGIHFNTAKDLIEEFSSIYNSMNKLKESGIETMTVKTPAGTPRILLLPSMGRLKELEEIERELGIEPEPEIIDTKAIKNLAIIDMWKSFPPLSRGVNSLVAASRYKNPYSAVVKDIEFPTGQETIDEHKALRVVPQSISVGQAVGYL